MDKSRTRVEFSMTIASTISVVFLLIIIAHQIWPCLIFDKNTMYLIILGILPWLTFFFKKFAIPGIIEGETRDRAQNTSDKPIPPSLPLMQDQRQIGQLSQNALKIMATLWRYQKQHFKDDYSQRWTFLIFPNSPIYSQYLSGVSELLNQGLISVVPENHQIMLTNEGIKYIQEHEDIQNHVDYYPF